MADRDDASGDQLNCGNNQCQSPATSNETKIQQPNVTGSEGALPKAQANVKQKTTGDAPIMKQKKWTVEADRNVGSIIMFIKKYLKLDSSESLFLYVNQAFAPSPDQLLRNLYECFGTDGKLVLHYCKTQAWG